MANHKRNALIVAIVTAVAWGALFYRGGASTASNMVLIIGGMLAGTLLSLDWADSYTS